MREILVRSTALVHYNLCLYNRRTLRHLLYALFCVICLAALIWPGYLYLGNRIEPLILGLPFSLVWVVGWAIANFIALLAYDWAGRRAVSDHSVTLVERDARDENS